MRLKLDPRSRVKLRFVDAETGAPIPGVTMVDADYWTALVTDANGLLEVVQQSRRKFMTAVLAAHQPDHDAASRMGTPPTYAASSPPLVETCPSWFPPGDYFIACGEGVAQPVTLVEGEVLEWALPAP